MDQIKNNKRKYKQQLVDKVERKKQKKQSKNTNSLTVRKYKKKDTLEKFDLEMHLQQFRDEYNRIYNEILNEILKAIDKEERVYVKTVGHMIGVNTTHYYPNFYCDKAINNIVYELNEKGYKATYTYYSDKFKRYDSDGNNYENYKQLKVYL